MTFHTLAEIVKATLMLIFCLLFVSVGLTTFILFRPNIKAGLRSAQDWVFNNTEEGCDISLSSIKGNFCVGRDSAGNVYYANKDYKIYIK